MGGARRDGTKKRDLKLDCEGSGMTLKSLDFNAIARREIYMTSWSDTEESKHLKSGKILEGSYNNLKEDAVFFSFSLNFLLW